MGFSQLITGVTNFSKFIISDWFRVPAASLTAAQNQFTSTWQADLNYDWNLSGIVPLITFGADGVFSATDTGGGSPFNMGGSYIGINCGEFSSFNNGNVVASPHLVVKLQTSTDISAADGLPTTRRDDAFVAGYIPNGVKGSAFSTSPTAITVTGDHWHHVIVSGDLTNGCAASGLPWMTSIASKLWIAFDDADKNGSYLVPAYAGSSSVGGFAASPNDVLSGGLTLSGPVNLPTNGQAIAFPTKAANSARVYNIERGPFQMFVGVSLDTSLVANRRLFVTSDGKPADATLAANSLGVNPIIRFDTSRDWITGNNNGSAGNLTPSGTISKYDINPFL